MTRAYYGVPDPQNSGAGYVLDDNFNGFDAGGAARGYDALGNRQGNNYQNSAGWTWYTRRDTGVNQYLKFGVATATYDSQYYNAPGNGVLMQDNWITASYNALNQPVAISSPSMPSGQFTWFGYDPLGRCVKRWVGPATATDTATNPATYYYYDGWNLVQEGPAAATADWIYFHGARVDELIASHQFSTNFWNYYHYDARGHVSLLTDETGALKEQYDYRAFGDPLFFNGAGTSITGTARGNRFLFTGREWLKELKLYDYRHRLYQPVLGRFPQPDPKEFDAGDYNLYRYCHNDPINKSDPTGLFYVIDVTSDGGVRGTVPGSMAGSQSTLAAAYHQTVKTELAAFETKMNAGSRGVTWRGTYQEFHGEKGRFSDDRTVATSEWGVDSKATVTDGIVARFDNTVRFKTHWNDDARDEYQREARSWSLGQLTATGDFHNSTTAPVQIRGYNITDTFGKTQFYPVAWLQTSDSPDGEWQELSLTPTINRGVETAVTVEPDSTLRLEHKPFQHFAVELDPLRREFDKAKYFRIVLRDSGGTSRVLALRDLLPEQDDAFWRRIKER